jgi:hypothetical protein
MAPEVDRLTIEPMPFDPVKDFTAATAMLDRDVYRDTPSAERVLHW